MRINALNRKFLNMSKSLTKVAFQTVIIMYLRRSRIVLGMSVFFLNFIINQQSLILHDPRRFLNQELLNVIVAYFSCNVRASRE